MCRRVLGCFFLLVILAAAGVAYLAFYAPMPHRHLHASISKAQQAGAEKRVASALDNPVPAPLPHSPAALRTRSAAPRARAAAYSAMPSQQREYAVRLRQDDLNTVLASRPDVVARLRQAKIEGAAVAFSVPDKIVLTADLQLRSNRVREIQLVGTLSATPDGDVAFHTTGGQLGMLPLPVSSDARIDARAARLLALALPKLPITVRELSCASGTLTLTGPKR